MVEDFAGKRAVFYARVSTAEEEQLNAIKLQIEENKAVIKAKGWELVDQYIDRGKSGTRVQGRKQYQRLLEDLESDKFDIIVAKSQDRLQRNSLDWHIFIDKLIRNKKKLYLYLDNKFFKSSEDRLITSIKAEIAAEFSRDLSKKLNNANKNRVEKARRGEPISAMGNGQTYGFKIVDKKWVIDEEQAPLVQKMYELYLELHSVRKVRDALNEQGYRNQKGKLFTEDSVSGVLKNVKNKGWVIVNKDHREFDTKKIITLPEDEWVIKKNDHEPIVSEEVWDAVNDEIKSHRNHETGRGVHKGTDIFSGKLYCAHCGGVLWKHGANKYTSWYCSSKMRRGSIACDDPVTITTVALNKIFNEITDTLLSFDVVELSKTKVKRQALKWLNELKDKLSAPNDNDKIQDEIEKLERKKDKLTEAYMEEIISKNDYKIKYSELEDKLAELKKSIVPIEENDDILEIEETIRNIDREIDEIIGAYAEDPQVKANFIIEHIKRMTVFKNKELAIELDLFAGALLVADGGILFQVEGGDGDFMLYDRESMPLPHGRVRHEGSRLPIRSFRPHPHRLCCHQHGGDRQSGSPRHQRAFEAGGHQHGRQVCGAAEKERLR